MLDVGFDIPTCYDRHFDVLRAATPRLVHEAYRLRYQVYCVENPFEDPEQHISACECDDDDERSIHTLLLHRRTGEIAGTTRVILPDPLGLRPLPMATLLQGDDRRRFDSFSAGQYSRAFAVCYLKAVSPPPGRGALSDVGFGDPAVSVVETERRLMPFISLGLIRGMFGICLERRITHLAAVMEPPLIRILNRLGLHFHAHWRDRHAPRAAPALLCGAQMTWSSTRVGPTASFGSTPSSPCFENTRRHAGRRQLKASYDPLNVGRRREQRTSRAADTLAQTSWGEPLNVLCPGGRLVL